IPCPPCGAPRRPWGATRREDTIRPRASGPRAILRRARRDGHRRQPVAGRRAPDTLTTRKRQGSRPPPEVGTEEKRGKTRSQAEKPPCSVIDAVRAPALPPQSCFGGRFGRGRSPPSGFPSAYENACSLSPVLVQVS